MAEKQLAVVEQQQSLLPTAETWDQILRMGQSAHRSGLLPSTIKTPEAAAIIILRGIELGLPAMVALDSLYVVNNKIGVSADMLLAAIRKEHPKAEIIIKKSDDKECIIMAKRPEQKDLTEFKYTIQEAQTAGLTGKDNWKKHPADMLFARCVSRMKRRIFNEVLKGLSHTPEELEDLRDVTPQTQVTQTETAPVTNIKSASSLKNHAPQTKEEAENWKPSAGNESGSEPDQQPDENIKDVEEASDQPEPLDRKKMAVEIAAHARKAGYTKETYVAKIKELTQKDFNNLTDSELMDIAVFFESESNKKGA